MSKSWPISSRSSRCACLNALVCEQPAGLLNGLQRAFGVLGDPGQHPLALSLLPPPAIWLLTRPRIVEIQARHPTGPPRLVDAGDRVKQLAHSVTNQPDRVLSGRRAEHRRRVDDLLRRPLKQPDLLRQPERVLKRQLLLAMQQQPGPKPINDVGCQPS